MTPLRNRDSVDTFPELVALTAIKRTCSGYRAATRIVSQPACCRVVRSAIVRCLELCIAQKPIERTPPGVARRSPGRSWSDERRKRHWKHVTASWMRRKTCSMRGAWHALAIGYRAGRGRDTRRHLLALPQQGRRVCRHVRAREAAHGDHVHPAGRGGRSVSYTHLTLPTIYSV